MSPATAASRYPRRKRQNISYSEHTDDEASDVDVNLQPKPEPGHDHNLDQREESDEDPEYGTRKKKKARKTTPEKKREPKPKREKPFPFMDLPPELRNAIYDFCLRDPDGIHIRSYQGRYRRMAVHCSPAECKSQYSGRSWWPQPPQPNDSDPERRRYDLIPNILATSKTIYAEAASMFYEQDFFIADTYALQALLLRMGPTGVAKLHNLTIISWCQSRSHKTINLPAFTLLRDATSLQRMHIQAPMGWYTPGRRWSQSPDGGEKGDAERAALIGRKVYRDCFPWLDAVVRRGGLKAMEDVLDVGEVNIRPAQPYTGNTPTPWPRDRDAKMRRLVFEEVFRLLELRA